MPGTLQPLDQKFQIVREDRTPTEYFIRWAQQKQIDIGDSITAEQAVQILEDYLADHQLQEGSGIQITPSGNLSDMPTIAADVQEILDQISTTRGSIIYRGLLGWAALPPGASGEFLKSQGAGADPVWAAGGGGGSPYTPPLLANFPTALNIGAETTVADTTAGMVIMVGAGGAGTVLRCRLKAYPAPPFSIITKFQFNSDNQTGDGVGLMIRDSVGGRMLKFGVEAATGGGPILQRWANSTTFSSTTKGGAGVIEEICFKFNDDGVNHNFYLGGSIYGPWYLWLTQARLAYLPAIDQIGFGVEDQNSEWYNLLVQHYNQF